MDYLTSAPADEFVPAGPCRQPVLLNTDKLRFRLIKSPTIAELQTALMDYAMRRLESYWAEMLELPRVESWRIKLFSTQGNSLLRIPKPLAWSLIQVTSVEAFDEKLKGMSLADQRALANTIKPRTVPAMLSTLISTKIEDTTGYAYLSAALAESQDAAQFFGGLVNGLFSNLADTNQRLGTPYQAKHQRRVLEFLGYAANKGWLLFPFVHHSSGLQEHYILSHARNMECIFNPAY